MVGMRRIFGLAVVGLMLAALFVMHTPAHSAASAYQEQATVYNCDGGSWAFRFSRLPNGAIGVGYGYAPLGGDRGAIHWSDDVGIGGNVADVADISASCVIGRVFVFARFVAPVDGSARLYERHGYPEDLANGQGAGWSDWWYHWR